MADVKIIRATDQEIVDILVEEIMQCSEMALAGNDLEAFNVADKILKELRSRVMRELKLPYSRVWFTKYKKDALGLEGVKE